MKPSAGNIAKMAQLYEFTAQNIYNKDVPLRDLIGGKVALIVNVASKCGFTGQYEGLQELYNTFKDRGFTIVGFPCNQFGGQEPGDEKAIEEFACSRFKVSFPLMKKVDVNGDKAHPVYDYLKKTKPGILGIQAVKWNFEKFLVDRDGKVVGRYASTTTPADIAKDVEKLL